MHCRNKAESEQEVRGFLGRFGLAGPCINITINWYTK
jgi:hypothetical protein